MSMYSYCMFIYVYTDWGFSVLFPQLQGKRQGKTRQDGARPELFLILVLLYVFCVLLYVFLCCSMYFLCCSMYVCVALCIFVLFYVCFVVLCIVCFVSFSVLFVCICVLYYCHRMATQLQLNISYHNISRKNWMLSFQILHHEVLRYPIDVFWNIRNMIFLFL